MTRVAIVLLAFLMTVATAAGEERSLYLHRSFETEATPEAAYFLVAFEAGGAKRVEGVLVPPLSNPAPDGARLWQAGTLAPLPPNAGELVSSVVVELRDGTFMLLPPVAFKVDDAGLFNGSIDQLRTHLLKRKEEASSWLLQIEQQEDSLRRLRADAEIVGNLGRIVEARNEQDILKTDIQNLIQDKKNLENLVKLARTLPPPKNMLGRERQLQRQLAELTDLAKVVESGELERRSAAERGLQAKLSLLEETRSMDPEALQRELIRLRKRRRDLEAVVGESPQVEPQ